MKYITINFVLLLLYFISTINQIQCTCVLESDFGFSINCNFKKSGLFRVRNLGGVKAHFGLGFSVGDELGFPESLGNLEGSKRRALNLKTGVNQIGVLPASQMPIVPIKQSRPKAVTSQYQMVQPLLVPIVATPSGFKKPIQMTLATSLPLGVPAFKPIPQDTIQVSSTTRLMPVISGGLNINSNQVPAFSAIPTSKVDSRISLEPVYQMENEIAKPLTLNTSFQDENLPQVDLKGHTVEELANAANVTVDVIKAAIKLRQKQLMFEKHNYSNQLKKKIVNDVNVQVTPSEVKTFRITQTPQTTTAAYKPKKKTRPISSNHKVMNAPKEYYPVGYDKNYDDNFKTKVSLPATSFHCGDQKHFPGLYADEDLECMVFHVCALTDDGLIMKSFLCPESTLFDQTILKCNWWFYTDCKSSKTLYDSNLPVSKSYQLMKSLAFFNANYKKSGNGTIESTKDNGIVEALSKSVKK